MNQTPPPARPLFMSWINHAWDRFLRARRRRFSSTLADFRCPSVPGLVSVVLPVYNGADYLRQAVASILAQTNPDLELILVNDGSTDATPEIIEEYHRRDPRIRVLHQENRGLPAALNAGFALARGQFLTWTSADNNLKPGCLARLAGDLQSRPAIDMIYADYEIIDEAGRPLLYSDWCRALQDPPGGARVRPLRDVSILNLIDGNYIGPAFLYRDRVAALLGPYDPALFSCEDYDFFMRVNAAMTLRHAALGDIVYEYRIHGGSLSARERDFRRAEKTRDLVLFDAFRRELLGGPACWFIEEDERPTPAAAVLARALRERIRAAGHHLLDAPPAFPPLPRLWLPCARVRITSLAAAPPPPPPSPCLSVLIHCGASTVSRPLPPEATFCISFSPNATSSPPQGWFSCASLETLWTAACLRLFSAQARAIADNSGTGTEIQASVIICTLGADSLPLALRSVCAQNTNGVPFEILVVNNNPALDLAPLIDAFRAEFFPAAPDRLRLVVCPIRGLSHARNAGLAEARGEIVVYLDDDAAARPGWLAALLADFAAHPDLGVLGGPVLAAPPRPAPAWFAEPLLKYWSHLQPAASALHFATDWTAFPIGANWAARRELLFRVGGFRTAYGRGGSQCDAGEEIAAALQIRQLGAAVALEPAAVVDHAVAPARFTLANLWRSIREGWMLRLHLEHDRLLPRTMRLRDLAWHAVKRLLRVPAPGLKMHERIEHALYSAAALRLAAALLRRQFQRLRKPLFKD